MVIRKKQLKAFATILFVLASVAYGWFSGQSGSIPDTAGSQANIYSLVEARQSGGMVTVEGEVVKILPDDNKGSRHQRFIIGLDGNLTLLVAHNIDLAPRVPLKINDKVQLHGQYEWNNKGGVLHWTHHDPRNQHEPGWIKFQNKLYE
jgi:hypothetical protein